MRKGLTIIEVIVVTAVLSFISVALAPLFRTLIKDIPASYRIVSENTILLGMLRQMRDDIESARLLPQALGKHVAGDEMLLIELTNGTICYQLEDGRMLRSNLTAAGKISDENVTDWSIPHSKVDWQVWRENGNGYAVEVKVYIEYKNREHLEKKMANSHLYFVGDCPGAVKQK